VILYRKYTARAHENDLTAGGAIGVPVLSQTPPAQAVDDLAARLDEGGGVTSDTRGTDPLVYFYRY
jgi:hypothetical protein